MPWKKSGFRTEFECSEEREDYWKKQPFKMPSGVPLDKFPGLNEDHIWGSLHDRYNTAPMVIMDKTAWYSDVIDVISASENVDEVHAELEKRRKQRLDECVSVITDTESCWHLGLSVQTPRRLQMRAQQLDQLSQKIARLHESGTLVDTAFLFLHLETILQEERKQTWLENVEALELEREEREEREEEERAQKPKARAECTATSDAPSQPGVVSAEPDSHPSSTEYTTEGTGKRKHEDSESEGSRDKRPRTMTPDDHLCATEQRTSGTRKRKRGDVESEAGRSKRPRAMPPPRETSQGVSSYEASPSAPLIPEDRCEDSGSSISHDKRQQSMTPPKDAGQDLTSPEASPSARPISENNPDPTVIDKLEDSGSRSGHDKIQRVMTPSTDAGHGPTRPGASPSLPPISHDRCKDSGSNINSGNGQRATAPPADAGHGSSKTDASVPAPPVSDDRCKDSGSSTDDGKRQRVTTPPVDAGHGPSEPGASISAPPVSESRVPITPENKDSTRAPARPRIKKTRISQTAANRPLSSFRDDMECRVSGDEVFWFDESFRSLRFAGAGRRGLGYRRCIDRAVREIEEMP